MGFLRRSNSYERKDVTDRQTDRQSRKNYAFPLMQCIKGMCSA